MHHLGFFLYGLFFLHMKVIKNIVIIIKKFSLIVFKNIILI
jgi:hypothetical protein